MRVRKMEKYELLKAEIGSLQQEIGEASAEGKFAS